KPQLNTCGLVPLIAQPVTAGVSAHVTPPPSGSVSVSVTLLATPVPVLVTTIVKVAVSPALIICPSGVLTTVRLGGRQVMLPVSVVVGSLPELTDARFGIDVHAVKLVAALNTMVFDAPAAMSP